MSNIIRSYGLDISEKGSVCIPKGAEILSVGVNKEFNVDKAYEVVFICVKEEVDAPRTFAEEECFDEYEFAVVPIKRHFYIDEYKFLGTVILGFGSEIYNVLYRKL